jgi:hypothetical protein
MRKYCKSGSNYLKNDNNYLVVVTSPYPTPTPTPVYFMGRIDPKEISWEYEEISIPIPTPAPNS